MANKCAAYKSKPNPYQLIRKAVELIENPLSANYIDRHVVILNDFLDACPCAVWVRDIPYIIKLFYIFSETVKSVPEYKPCFIRLLRLCSVPPMLIKSSEVLTFGEDIQEYFTVFGYLLVVLQDDELLDEILQLLKTLFTKPAIGDCCINSSVCNESLAKSNLPDTMSELMCVVDQEAYYKLLQTMEYLLHLDDTRKKFIQNGLINLILLKTYPEWNIPDMKTPIYTASTRKYYTIPYFDLSLRILWNLLETKQKYPEIYTERLVTSDTWRSVQHLLRILTTLNMKKQKRNNLVSLVLLLLKLDDATITCGTANDLALLCAASEIGVGGTWASEIVFTQDIHDYKLKKLLYLVVSYFPRNHNITSFLYERQIVLSILRLISPEVELPWNEKQRCKLMKYALLTLCEVMEITFDDFVKYNGPVRMLKMVDAYMKSQVRQCILIACLHCIHKSLSINRNDIATKYRENNAADIIVELLTYMTNLDVLTREMQHAMVCAFCIAEMLNVEYEYNRIDVIDTCLLYIERCLQPYKEDFLSSSKLLIACLDFIWENVTWSTSTFKHFIHVGGTYALLDVIQSSCFPVQLTALSMLVDLCEEGSCIPHLLTWRGNGQTAIPMFLEIFRKENIRIGVKSTHNGIISDLELPLMGEKQFQLTFRNTKDPNSSPAIIDTIGSCRPKIYALVHLINCHKAEITEAVNERYKISASLTLFDEITQLLVTNYLPLKFGEIWVELKQDVDVSGIRPLVYDQEIISTMVRRFYKWSMNIKNAQEELAEKQNTQEIIEEKIFYNYLREAHLSEALDALDELRFIARCTEHIFRLMAKMKQKDQLRKTWLYDPEFYVKFHMTFMHTIDATSRFFERVSETDI